MSNHLEIDNGFNKFFRVVYQSMEWYIQFEQTKQKATQFLFEYKLHPFVTASMSDQSLVRSLKDSIKLPTRKAKIIFDELNKYKSTGIVGTEMNNLIKDLASLNHQLQYSNIGPAIDKLQVDIFLAYQKVSKFGKLAKITKIQKKEPIFNGSHYFSRNDIQYIANQFVR